jgi:O-antigen ligase
LGFALFIVLNAVLFIRPTEVVPALDQLPIYEVLILLCVALSLPVLVEQLKWKVLRSRPINLCVLGMLPAVVLSHASHFAFGAAWEAGFHIGKILVYYLLFISLVTSHDRLRSFLLWLVGFVLVLATLALLQYHGVIDIAALQPVDQRMGEDDMGDAIVIPRLCSTGIFHDPNDLCLILIAGMTVSLYLAARPGGGLARLVWGVALALFGYALLLTHSRGGFMAFLAAFVTFLLARFGWKKSVPIILVLVPVLFLLFAGRQTSVDLSDPDDTSQQRLQLWRDGLELWKSAPLFGVGKDEYAERVGLVAHNSFMHCYAELGLFGGTIFTGIFFCSLWALYRVRSVGACPVPSDLSRLPPYLLATTVGYVVGILALSRAYVVPTYLLPALAASYVALPEIGGRVPLPKFNSRLLLALMGVGILTLACIILIVKIFAR